MKRRAFTLVELLVVVTIIALLIAILIPSVKKAREQSKATACMSNLRSLALAVQMYAMTNDDHLITAGLAHGGVVNVHAAWINTLEAVYGKPLVSRCPSDKSLYWTNPWDGTDQLRRASYATNYYTVAAIADKGPYDRLSLIKRPATTILRVELAEDGEYAVADHVHPETWKWNPDLFPQRQVSLKRHLERAHYSFIDGHVERLRFKDTFAIDDEASKFPKFVFNRNMYDPAIAK
jgi:prepilin-type N-terminal cleavage/methylation domain-containing protein/prepilin-type processing-associated H-X9-DG protein